MDEDSREGTGKREAGKKRVRFERKTSDNRFSSGPSRRRRESSSSSSSFAVPAASSAKKLSKKSPSLNGKNRGSSCIGTHSKVDAKAKLERSRQSARECRARKKLRYQYLEDLVNKREKAVMLLHKELESVSIKQCIKTVLMLFLFLQNRELFQQVESGKKPVEALKAILDQSSN